MAMLELALGAAGTIALIIAWIWETWENVQKHKIVMHLHFSLLYCFGNILLAIYAWQIGSMVFFVLGLFLLAAIAIETGYAIKTGGLKAKSYGKRRVR